MFVGRNDERDAYVVDIMAELFTLWSDHPTKIAQLELLTVYYVGFIFVASQARACHSLRTCMPLSKLSRLMPR